MSTRYKPLLAAIVTALQAVNPARNVTRLYADFAYRPEPALLAGVWTVQPGGITRYPYEVSDGGFDSDSLRATENGRLLVRITGQLLLPADCTGLQIDDAEFDLVHELEQLADAAIEHELLGALVLLDVQMSAQIEAPYAWVNSTWEVFPIN